MMGLYLLARRSGWVVGHTNHLTSARETVVCIPSPTNSQHEGDHFLTLTKYLLLPKLNQTLTIYIIIIIFYVIFGRHCKITYFVHNGCLEICDAITIFSALNFLFGSGIPDLFFKYLPPKLSNSSCPHVSG